MSPLVHGYSYLVEESAPLFAVSSPYVTAAFGALWGIIWTIRFDVILLTLPWLILTPFAGVAFYVACLWLLIDRYRQTPDNPKLIEVVGRAKNRVGYAGDIQVWERRSDRPLLMSSHNAPFAAILVSDTTVKDILENEENGEALLAYRIAGLSHLGRLHLLLSACVYSSVGAFAYFVISIRGTVFFHNPLLLVFPAALTVMIVALIRFATIQDRKTKGRNEEVYRLYGKTMDASLLSVFGLPLTSEDRTEYVEGLKPGKEKEGLPFLQNSLATEVEEMLATEDKRAYQVRFVTRGPDRGSLLVFGLRAYCRDDALCQIPEAIVGLFPHADMLGPYVAYEMAASKTKAKEGTYGILLSMPALALFFAVMFVQIVTGSHTVQDELSGLAAFFLLSLYIGVAGLAVHYWRRMVLFKLDLTLAGEHPGHIESIRVLSDARYETGPGWISLRERLQHLDRASISKDNS
jgi:hypothetical protein